MPQPEKPARVNRTVTRTAPLTTSVSAPVPSNAEASFCELTGDDQPEEVCVKFARQQALNLTGRYGFNPKSPMTEGKEETVIFTIGAINKTEQITDTVSDKNRAASFGDLTIGAYNYAILTGDVAFKITPVSNEVRSLRGEPITTWRWLVVPLYKGDHKLTINAGVELRVPGQEPQRIGADSISKSIEVKVIPGGQFDELWACLERLFNGPMGALAALTALIGAVGALWFAIKKFRGNTVSTARANEPG